VITDSDFVKGIEYLVNSGIIQVKQTTQSQIDTHSLEIDARPSDDTDDITQSTASNCDPSYPDVCIPPYPPDLDCGEIGYSNFRVIGSDPHRFDGDKDGIGCES
jgi:hypothetical protein